MYSVLVAGASQGFCTRAAKPYTSLTARGHYRFLLTGLRFSMNAAMPSERSSSAKVA
ncbi:hypothetical protein ABIF97_005512 [Bradyrhizobium japonicum]